MRGVHIIIPVDKEQMIIKALENLNLKYEKMTCSETTLIMLSISDEHVETVVDAIRKIGVGTLYGSYQVYTLEFAAETTAPEVKPKTRRISREEILSDIWPQAEFNKNYIIATILASILATLGLLTDNIIITIASMIIAPFFGPIIGVSLGIVLNIRELRSESFKSEVVGLITSVLTGFFFSLMLPYSTPTSRILAVSYPTYIDIMFAITAGLAASISVISATPLSLVGVAIAASLVPPAVNIGIGMTFALRGEPLALSMILGSAQLLTINVLAINTMSLVFFWIVGIKPAESIRKEIMARKMAMRRLLGLTLVFMIVAAPILVNTINYYHEKSLESQMKNDIRKFIKTYYQDIVIINLDIAHDRIKNITYVYLDLGVRVISDDYRVIADEIAQIISMKYKTNVIVFMKLIIISREVSALTGF